MTTPLIEFLHDTTLRSVPDPIRQEGRRLLLDIAGVAAGGSRTRLSEIIRTHALRQFGGGASSARMLVDGRRVSPAGAALAGGMTIDALDAHDGHKLTKGHVGCGAVPAALAVAEAEDRLDGDALLTAVVLGYEIGSRAGIALHRTVADYHTSGAWVAIACAALGARAIGLGPVETRHAIGIAEYHGPRSQMMRVIDHPTMLKDGSGWGAMAGISAAYLAADGFTGAPAITVESPDVADLWGTLGQRWYTREQYIKPHPVCRWAQAPIAAVLALREAHGLTSADVERIEIETFHEAVRLATRRPRTTEEAQYSTAFPTAAALVRGKVGSAEVEEAAFRDREIMRVADSIVVTEDDECNNRFPAQRCAKVSMLLTDGRRISSGLTEAVGDAESPLAMSEVRAKFHGLADPVLGRQRASALEGAIDMLGRDGGSGQDVARLMTDPAKTAAAIPA
ncbi:MAG: MmgE/PrpD family protein [Pseudomonadota bacterium]